MKGKSKSKKIYEQVAEHIKQMIEQGAVQPGDKLPPMTELALEYGVSRATVREAFSSLVGMGLIDLRHGEGTFVQKIDVQTMIIEPMNAALLLARGDLRQLLEVRRMLETATVRYACLRRTPEALQRIEAAYSRMAQPGQNLEERVSCDLQFHLAIAEASGNNALYNLMNTLSEAIRSTMHVSHREAESEERLLAEHRAICAAITLQNEELAAELIDRHLLQPERSVLPQNQQKVQL